MCYSLNDGPGEEAKVVRWAAEDDLAEWEPVTQTGPLIDLS